jgi:hypothetical protein
MFSVQKAALVETHLLAAAAANQNPHQKTSIKKSPCPPSASLLYTVVNKEVEQQFSGRGVTL